MNARWSSFFNTTFSLVLDVPTECHYLNIPGVLKHFCPFFCCSNDSFQSRRAEFYLHYISLFFPLDLYCPCASVLWSSALLSILELWIPRNEQTMNRCHVQPAGCLEELCFSHSACPVWDKSLFNKVLTFSILQNGLREKTFGTADQNSLSSFTWGISWQKHLASGYLKDAWRQECCLGNFLYRNHLPMTVV